ncbi:hypothetical protein QWY14_10665 [Planococcus sp. N028]|uniref:Uncharacterized protein n=1 Tax=Planococcus shixiaomingii TaxID=3058393 RepID=A0ABT8N2Z4_9BACL|nr:MULTISPECIES: hypothetical protein [unclassified Planococcus (in: firmicutes)]MDN7242264.1 hypothetical protein [Planococcus sp. N028]WKA54517.1 hypothetical protein QWY21_17895 [Planococcus sp. N022]
MQLILSIILSTILGYLLLMMGPWVGDFLAFGIITGTLFRGLYLLNDIHKRLLKDAPELSKAKQAREDYLKQREQSSYE